MHRVCLLWCVALLADALGSGNAFGQSCSGSPVAVQILGSGGPFINPFRSSAGYLLWVGNQAKFLVDTGGGSYHRFGQSQAKLEDLSLVGISHPIPTMSPTCRPSFG
jgi:hypothetical protein